MARMSREFNLVLLGAGLLTAGSLLIPEEDPVKRAEKDAANGGGGSGYRHRPGFMFLYLPGSVGRSNTVASTSSISRGGFGRSGFAAGG